MRPFIAMLFFCVAPVWAQALDRIQESNHPIDSSTPVNELLQMAERGHPSAQYHLALKYEYGRGIRRSDINAVSWYRKASLQGMSAAQYRLGVMYDNGWGVPISDTEAVKWYLSAAAQGHSFAQHDLAFMYVAGTGVPQNYVLAYKWLDIAVAKGNSVMIKHLKHVSKHLTPAEIEEAQKMARVWMSLNR